MKASNQALSSPWISLGKTSAAPPCCAASETLDAHVVRRNPAGPKRESGSALVSPEIAISASTEMRSTPDGFSPARRGAPLPWRKLPVNRKWRTYPRVQHAEAMELAPPSRTCRTHKQIASAIANAVATITQSLVLAQNSLLTANSLTWLQSTPGQPAEGVPRLRRLESSLVWLRSASREAEGDVRDGEAFV